MTAPLDPARLFTGLHAAGIEHIVIGGFAVIAHGVVRTTKDLDICPDPEPHNLERLASFLSAVNATQLGVGDFDASEMPFDPTDPTDLAAGGNFRLTTELGDLDVMQWIPGLPEERAYATLAPAATTGLLGDVPVRVCSLKHLRQMKRAAGRPQDVQDLSDLELAHPEDR